MVEQLTASNLYLYGIEIFSEFGNRSLQILCSNCTFMELKSDDMSNGTLQILRSNCTFMELKFKMLDDIFGNCAF